MPGRQEDPAQRRGAVDAVRPFDALPCGPRILTAPEPKYPPAQIVPGRLGSTTTVVDARRLVRTRCQVVPRSWLTETPRASPRRASRSAAGRRRGSGCPGTGQEPWLQEAPSSSLRCSPAATGCVKGEREGRDVQVAGTEGIEGERLDVGGPQAPPAGPRPGPAGVRGVQEASVADAEPGRGRRRGIGHQEEDVPPGERDPFPGLPAVLAARAVGVGRRAGPLAGRAGRPGRSRS